MATLELTVSFSFAAISPRKYLPGALPLLDMTLLWVTPKIRIIKPPYPSVSPGENIMTQIWKEPRELMHAIIEPFNMVSCVLTT
jgi:hypothetical protein